MNAEPLRPRRLRGDALALGASAGLLQLILLLRLNPELDLSAAVLAGAVMLWASWGLPTAGLPLLAAALIARRVRPASERARSWPMPELGFAVFVLAAVTSRVNADLHPEFLSGRGQRTLGQDAVAWLVAGLLVLFAGIAVRRRGAPPWGRVVFAVVAIGLPLLRISFQPTPLREAETVAARRLGAPERALVVLGIDGLDASVLLPAAGSRRYPALARLVDEGAWGPVDAYLPFLRQSLWTTLATGTYPRRHGLTSRWRWELAWPRDLSFQLLPWPQLGSGWVMPWGLARRRQPAPPAIPALWDRFTASGIDTEVWDWPGSWPAGAVSRRTAWPPATALLDPVTVASLDTVLEPFPDLRENVLRAVEGDLGRMGAAADALERGAGSVWVHLRMVAEMRRRFESLDPRDSAERAVWDLLLEILDDRFGALVARLPPGTLVAVASPYGFAAPGPAESLKRLLGIGGGWRTSPEGSPDGVLVLSGEGVVAGHRVERAQLADVAPTLCYLIGLPVAQYMEGRVMLDAIDPAYLASHPLQVVD